MITLKEKPESSEDITAILNPLVKRWFFSRFREFSLPQAFAVMDIHSRKNVLVSAPTGATKTLTAFLSILNELVDSAQKGILKNKVYCVYVSPLKALNYDIEVNLTVPLAEMEAILQENLGIRVAVRTGDTTPLEKTRMLKEPPHILITTPESLAILLSSTKFVEHLRSVEWVIVDEIHALAENKRGVHLSLSLERLEAITPGMARVGLSATVAPIDEIAKFLVGFAGDEPRDCVIVNVPFIKKIDLQVISPVKSLITTSYDEKQRSMYRLLNEMIQQHTTTLIFTNTRAATERVVHTLKEQYPTLYKDNIGAHHGSLSKEHRRSLEKRMREGRLRAVVSSTSLELGIDIGYIDLVVLLGSPKSVARALQRIGRSGHKLHETTKGRIIVMDRDDLVECSVLLRNALLGKVDRIAIPQNCLDVLSQHIFGISIERKIKDSELFELVKKSYSFHTLSRADFNAVIDYLAGEYIGLEERSVYAKIWHADGMIGKKGKLARVLYMTNVGTIPDETFITVKVGNQAIGQIDESFLERLRRGDVFVLGGEKYEFLHAKGTVAYVNASVYRPPTVPSWFSEMLPLSFDLANDIGIFRRLMSEKLKSKNAMEFLRSYLSVDDNSLQAIYEYMSAQSLYASIPTDRKIIAEHYNEGQKNLYIFHALFGRRVNDALSRAFAYAASRVHHRDFEIGISDNGFYIAAEHPVNIREVVKVLLASDFDSLLKLSLEKTEILRRRFRHVATRGLMILRNYMGRTKRVGRQQVSSMLLLNAVQRLGEQFPLLKEAKREILDDMMDRQNAKSVINMIKDGKIEIEHIETKIPSPFAFNLVVEAHLDLLRIEDKAEFLKRMHQMVMAKIALDKKKSSRIDEFSYEKEWGE